MPSDHLAMLVLPPADDLPPLRGTIEQDVAAPWSTETRPEKALPAEEPQVSAWTPPPANPTGQRLLPQSRPPIRDFALAKRLAQIAPGASRRVLARFNAAKIAWPPREVGLVAIKDEKTVDMYGRDEAGKWKLIHRYKVLAASGGSGPKLRQGDRQVPEGIYAISYLNPHSRYHVSLRVNYPNAFDRKMAAADGRRDLGGDIMIHGKASSIGCLAVGDEAAEEIFWLAAEIGQRNLRLVIAPTDFRRRSVPGIEAGAPKWLPKLYTEVAAAMAEYPTPPQAKITPISLLSFFGN
jgi:L,D-transpeptidase catalytic domain